MRRHSIKLTIVALLFGTQIFLCSASAQETRPSKPIQVCPEVPLSPSDTLRAFYEASKEKDVATLKKLMSKAALAVLEDDLKKEGLVSKTLDDHIRAQSQVGLPKAMPEIRNEKIEGGRATAEMHTTIGSGWHVVSFAKEDGCWKVNFK